MPCDDNVLKDTAAPGVPQTDRLKPYEKRPWQQELVRKDGLLSNSKHMQVFEPLGPVADFTSMIVALICGGITSRFGGFWFYPGAIISFIVGSSSERKGTVFGRMRPGRIAS